MSRKIVSSRCSTTPADNSRQKSGRKTTSTRAEAARTAAGHGIRSTEQHPDKSPANTSKRAITDRQSRSHALSKRKSAAGTKKSLKQVDKKHPRTVAGRTGQRSSARLSDAHAGSRTRSASGAFVDARALQTDEAVLKRTSDDGVPSIDVFVKPKVVDFKARLEERKRADMQALVVRWSMALMVVLVITAMIWGLCFSPALLLQGQQIMVSGGNEWVSNQQVSTIVKREEGRSLLLISSSDIERDMGALPGVTQAKVTKHFPHGLEVTFKAQEPAAVLKAADGKITAVDRDGGVLNTVGDQPKGIPLIEVGTAESGVKNRAVQQALKVLSALPGSMRARISKVTAQTQDSVTTELDGGQKIVLWGDASDLALKIAVVDKIINDPTKIADKHQVDVSAPMRPIIK